MEYCITCSTIYRGKLCIIRVCDIPICISCERYKQNTAFFYE